MARTASAKMRSRSWRLTASRMTKSTRQPRRDDERDFRAGTGSSPGSRALLGATRPECCKTLAPPSPPPSPIEIVRFTAHPHRQLAAQSNQTDLDSQRYIGTYEDDKCIGLGLVESRRMPPKRRIPLAVGVAWRNWQSASRNRLRVQGRCSGTRACKRSRFDDRQDYLQGRN